MAQNVARLGVVLGLDTAEFQKGIDAAKRQVTGLVNSLPMVAAAAGAAFTAMTAKALAFADSMSDLADANEMSIESILGLSEALAMSGGDAENAGKILASFTSKLDDAAQGGKTAQESFKRIGIGLKDLGSLSNAELFDKTVANLAKMPDIVSRNAAAFDLLGRGIRGVSITGLAAEMSHGTDEFKKYADAVRVAGELNDKLHHSTHKIALSFTNAFLPTLNAVFEHLSGTGSVLEGIIDLLGKFFKGLVYAGEIAVTVFKSINAAVNLVGLTLDDISHGKFNTFFTRVKEYDQYIAKLREGNKEFARALLNTPQASKKEPFTVGREVKAAKDTDAEKLRNQLTTIKEISLEYERQQRFALQQLQTRQAMNYMTRDERRLQEVVNQVLDSTSKKLDEIAKLKEIAASNGNDPKAIKALDEQAEAVQRLSNKYVEAARTSEAAAIRQQRTFQYGWSKAFRQYAEDAYNYGRMGEEMFLSITGNMTNALDTFVETGKINFKNFAQSVIQDLIKIQLRMQMMQLFSMGARFAMGAMAGGGGEGTATVHDYSTPTGFATGGDPSSGVPHLIGENGPELFIPNRPGTIIPNNQLGDVMGGGGTTINGPYIASMNAIDTQSGIQFLAKNKMTIWSMNQSANRSIPAGR